MKLSGIFSSTTSLDYTNKLVLIHAPSISIMVHLLCIIYGAPSIYIIYYELRKSVVKKGCGNSKFLQGYRVEIRKIKMEDSLMISAGETFPIIVD